jgi:serine/threonine protein kinase
MCAGKGVTQRDIKPGNILLFPQAVNGRFTLVLKLADFGWAKRFDLSEGKTRVRPCITHPCTCSHHQQTQTSSTQGGQ